MSWDVISRVTSWWNIVALSSSISSTAFALLSDVLMSNKGMSTRTNAVSVTLGSAYLSWELDFSRRMNNFSITKPERSSTLCIFHLFFSPGYLSACTFHPHLCAVFPFSPSLLPQPRCPVKLPHVTMNKVNFKSSLQTNICFAQQGIQVPILTCQEAGQDGFKKEILYWLERRAHSGQISKSLVVSVESHSSGMKW